MIHQIPRPDDSHLLAAKAQLDAAEEELDMFCVESAEISPGLTALRLQLAQALIQFVQAQTSLSIAELLLLREARNGAEQARKARKEKEPPF